MKFINWPRSTLMRFAYIMPELYEIHTGKVVNTAGMYEQQMAPWAYWDATLQGWEDHGFKNSGRNRMMELIKDFGGPAQLYFGIMDTQGLEVLMTRDEWEAREKYWLQYCIDNGKWPFSIWLVPEDIEVLEGITDNATVTMIIDSMRVTPVKKHTLEGWMALSPANVADKYGDWDDGMEKIGAGRWRAFIDSNLFTTVNLSGSNPPNQAEDKKMEYLFPWNIQMEQIEDLTQQSWEQTQKNNYGMVEPDFRKISGIYNRILQEYERAEGRLVGFRPYPQLR